MKMAPLFPKKPAPDLDKVILETDVKLRMLKDRYETVLARELRQARYNKTKGKTDSNNYSKIGIAYYSLNIVETAQARLRDISDNQQLCKSMSEMSAALGVINGLSRKVGNIDVQDVLDNLRKMDSSAKGSKGNLANALGALSGVEKIQSQELPIESLVGRDIIEKLIDGAKVEECLHSDDGGATQDVNELFQAFSSEMLGNQEEEPLDYSNDPEEINRHINEMMSQLL